MDEQLGIMGSSLNYGQQQELWALTEVIIWTNSWELWAIAGVMGNSRNYNIGKQLGIIGSNVLQVVARQLLGTQELWGVYQAVHPIMGPTQSC